MKNFDGNDYSSIYAPPASSQQAAGLPVKYVALKCVRYLLLGLHLLSWLAAAWAFVMMIEITIELYKLGW